MFFIKNKFDFLNSRGDQICAIFIINPTTVKSRKNNGRLKNPKNKKKLYLFYADIKPVFMYSNFFAI